MVTIGRNAAVAYLARRCFAGFLAWIIWLGVHLFELIGFHNRILVLIDWAWDYLLYERTVRLILPSKMWGREGLSEAPSAKRPPAVPL
jgi:NADH dehydrogenase